MHLGEGGWSRGSEDFLSGLDGPVRERELEVLGEELSDVRTADEVGLFDFHNFEDLNTTVSKWPYDQSTAELTWIEPNRAL